MKNLESQVTAEAAPFRGRERVPTEAALEAQKKLVMYMTPDRLIPYIDSANSYDPFMEALMMRYTDMYDSGDYNGFAEYCNEHEGDSAFMDRVINQTLTPEDFNNMRESLAAHAGGSPFFADEAEVEKFIQANTH